jgi:Indigoidine synthase A like protein
MTNGVLFGVPIPESYAAVGKQLQEAVEQAIHESQANGMDKRGKELTPWLLDRVRELTSGKSLTSSECSSARRFCLNYSCIMNRCRADREHGNKRGSDSSRLR